MNMIEFGLKLLVNNKINKNNPPILIGGLCVFRDSMGNNEQENKQ